MNIEDYRDEKSHKVRELESIIADLKSKNRHLSEQLGDLNVTNLILKARIKELESKQP